MKLSEIEIKDKLAKLDSWDLQGAQIQKQFTCKNFVAAIKFVNLIADLAEKMDHHPDILVSNYNKVTITLTTHSAKGLTENDFNLAEQIEKVFK